MITAVDTSVLLDVLLCDPAHAESSLAALQKAGREGRLIVCEMVLAELSPTVGDDLEKLMRDWSLHFVPCSREAALLAGRHFASYLANGGKRGRIVADFLVAAHAATEADRLLCRDEGFSRRYFKNLTVWTP